MAAACPLSLVVSLPLPDAGAEPLAGVTCATGVTAEPDALSALVVIIIISATAQSEADRETPSIRPLVSLVLLLILMSSLFSNLAGI
jgi:hypothetical protein